MRYLLIILLLFIGCDDNTVSPVTCDGVIDECGVCNGDGAETNYIEECGYQNVCEWEEGPGYCNSSSCQSGSSCSSSSDCDSNSNLSLGCDNFSMCIPSQEYVCEDEYVCDGEYVTECP